MSSLLGLGKVTKKEFNKLVLPFIPTPKNPELDGITLNLTGETVIAHSPSIGVPLESLGFFAFHYSASNVAARFGKPTYMVTGIYLPLKTPEKDLQTIAKSLGDEAKKYGVQIIAGQTATYYGLDIPLITSTCIGTQLKDSITPKQGDYVLLVGEIGGEGVWLNDLSQGIHNDEWQSYTPLPAILLLQSEPSVKIMHDISEGGVIGSLYEISESIEMRLDIASEEIEFHPRADEIGDILRAPSYGAFVMIISPSGFDKVMEITQRNGFSCHHIGEIRKGEGIYIDGNKVTDQKRINIDEVYGSFNGKKRTN